jgi:hypothetical protein
MQLSRRHGQDMIQLKGFPHVKAGGEDRKQRRIRPPIAANVFIGGSLCFPWKQLEPVGATAFNGAQIELALETV